MSDKKKKELEESEEIKEAVEEASEKNEDTKMSKSKKKRIAAENARRAQRAKKAMITVWAVLIPVAIVAAIVISAMMKYDSILDYSRYLTDEGYIKGLGDGDASIDYKSLTLAKADLLPDDATVQGDIDDFLERNESLSEDPARTADADDKVKLRYSSVMDGADYDASAEEGEDMKIGDETISSDFDAALVGHAAGDSYTVDITFPEDDVDADRAGKTATYTVSVDGIYDIPELTDELVSQNSAGYATVEEYKQSIIDTYYEANLREAVNKAVSDNVAIKNFPTKYSRNLEKVLDSQYKDQIEQYAQYLGQSLYSSPNEMLGLSEDEYASHLTEEAEEQTKMSVAAQCIFKGEGMTVSDEAVTEFYTEQGYGSADLEAFIDRYGKGYVYQNYVVNTAMDYMYENVNVTE
jgi:trigger factor